jgi:hypothetical protein
MEFNIDLILRKLGDGGKASAEELKAVQQAAAQGNDQAKSSLDKLSESEKENKKHTDHATESHKIFRDLVKGLHTAEIPALTRAFHLLQNPVSLITAALGVGISMWREWVQQLNEAALAAEELARAQSSISRVDIILSLAEAHRQFASAQDEIKRNANSAAVALNEETEAMLDQQRIAQELADAELALKLAQIGADENLTPGQKITATEQAQAEARHRKEQAAVQAAEDAAEAESKRIGIARGERGSAQAKLPTDEAIKAQQELAGHYAGQNKVLLPQLEKDKQKALADLEKAREARDAIVARIGLGNIITGAETVADLKEIRLPQATRDIDAKDAAVARIQKQIDAVGASEKNTAARLKELTEARERYNTIINEQTRIIEESTRKLEVLMQKWERLKTATPAISGTLDTAGQVKTGREATTADAAEAGKRQAEVKMREAEYEEFLKAWQEWQNRGAAPGSAVFMHLMQRLINSTNTRTDVLKAAVSDYVRQTEKLRQEVNAQRQQVRGGAGAITSP